MVAQIEALEFGRARPRPFSQGATPGCMLPARGGSQARAQRGHRHEHTLTVRIRLITAESPESRRLRSWRLIQFPQLTMPLIAALTPAEHEVRHTDEVVAPVRFDEPADLVGITAPTPSARHAYALAREFRRRGVPTVIGGPHATALPEEALEHADAVVVGEAEDTWPRVLADAARGTLGGISRSSGTAGLAGMPPPRWDLIEGRPYGRAVTIATRGCPHRCDYCSIPLLYGPGRVRYRPIDEVAAEVARSPTRAVVFWDDNLGANPRYAKELFRAIAPLRKWWTSQCTMAAARDDELLALAARSGCKALFLGLESVSQESLDGASKNHNRIAHAAEVIAQLHSHRIAAHLGIMFGFDGDDRTIFERTLAFLERTCVDVATVSMMVPMPGTPVFRRLEAEGRILTRDWSRYDGKRHCVFRPMRMTPEELVAGTEWVARRFYSLRSIARRLAGSRTGVWWNLPRNLGYRFALRQGAFPGGHPARQRPAVLGGAAAAESEPGPTPASGGEHRSGGAMKRSAHGDHPRGWEERACKSKA